MRATLICLLSVALVIVLAPSATAQTPAVSDDGSPPVGPNPQGGPTGTSFPSGGSLTTLFASNNQFAGNCFDIEATVPLTIVGFDVNITDPGSTSTIDIYYRIGTSFGAEGDPAGWILMGSDANVISNGQDVPTPVNIGGLAMTPGQVYGIYVDVQSYPSASMRYTDGGPTVYSNADLSLTTNCGKGNPAFFGSTFFPREWNGTIYYNLGVVPTMPQWAMVALAIVLLAGATLLFRRIQRA